MNSASVCCASRHLPWQIDGGVMGHCLGNAHYACHVRMQGCELALSALLFSTRLPDTASSLCSSARARLSP